ncbi:uncharacterized protein LOC5513265 isoform X1 [Nematostella vectensis]|uniref:uncharacterized protein LOC5513265 isoform X1 n=1 Tax=Nematostella vectensis TaxID=45351 RepID=UPI0020775F52|nr:uncharacterized protein LOC5513265 isoform X1 [Nematostella vectensis]
MRDLMPFLLVLVFSVVLLPITSASVLGTWFNCSSASCNATLSVSPCSLTGSLCQCDVAPSASTTCSLQTVSLANQTGAGLNTTLGPLSCCACLANETACCKMCAVTTTSSPATPQGNHAISTTSAPANYAKIVVAFVFEGCFSRNTSLASQRLIDAIGQLTSTSRSYIDVTKSTCVSGVQSNCGVDTSIVDSSSHRARRAVGGGRARGSSSDDSKKKDSSSNSYSTTLQYFTKTLPEDKSVPCESLVINATIWEAGGKNIEDVIKQVVDSVKNGSLGIQLPSEIFKATFIIFATKNSSYELHVSPYIYKPPIPTARSIPPLTTNLKPLIYTGGAVLGLISLCVIYQLVKQTFLLRRKKFTDINSDRVNSRKKRVEEVMDGQDAKDEERERGEFDMTFASLPRVDNDALTRRYDWTTPGYLPSMLAPAYRATEFHGQNSPPRLMLDDDDTDEEKNSLGKASVINVDDETDEDLRDILESDDESYSRPTSKRSSRTIRDPSATTRKTRKSSRNLSGKSNGNVSAKKQESNTKSPLPGKRRKCSYMGPEGREALKRESSPAPSFGNLKNNKVTPVKEERKPSVISLKPPKYTSSQT